MIFLITDWILKSSLQLSFSIIYPFIHEKFYDEFVMKVLPRYCGHLGRA